MQAWSTVSACDRLSKPSSELWPDSMHDAMLMMYAAVLLATRISQPEYQMLDSLLDVHLLIYCIAGATAVWEIFLI